MAKTIYLVEHTANMQNETDFLHCVENAFENLEDAMAMLDNIKDKVERADYPPLQGEKPQLISDVKMIRTNIIRGLKYLCVGTNGRVMYSKIYIYPITLI